MSIVVHTVAVHCGPVTAAARSRARLRSHIRRILTLGPAHVYGILNCGELVDLGVLTASLLNDAALLCGQVDVLVVAELSIFNDVSRAVGVVNNFTLKIVKLN